MAKGAYVLADAPDGKPDVMLLATGSEVSLCVDAYEKLKAEGIKARVVSMPSWELFEHQDAGVSRQRAAAGGDGARLGRAGVDVRLGRRYVGVTGACIGMQTFGASAPLKELQKKFGFTPERWWRPPRSSCAGEGRAGPLKPPDTNWRVGSRRRPDASAASAGFVVLGR